MEAQVLKYSKCPTCGFATIYETDKSKTGISQRRVRPTKIVESEITNADPSGSDIVWSTTEFSEELQGELPIPQ